MQLALYILVKYPLFLLTGYLAIIVKLDEEKAVMEIMLMIKERRQGMAAVKNLMILDIQNQALLIILQNLHQQIVYYLGELFITEQYVSLAYYISNLGRV